MAIIDDCVLVVRAAREKFEPDGDAGVVLASLTDGYYKIARKCRLPGAIEEFLFDETLILCLNRWRIKTENSERFRWKYEAMIDGSGFVRLRVSVFKLGSHVRVAKDEFNAYAR